MKNKGDDPVEVGLGISVSGVHVIKANRATRVLSSIPLDETEWGLDLIRHEAEKMQLSLLPIAHEIQEGAGPVPQILIKQAKK